MFIRKMHTAARTLRACGAMWKPDAKLRAQRAVSHRFGSWRAMSSMTDPSIMKQLKPNKPDQFLDHEELMKVRTITGGEKRGDRKTRICGCREGQLFLFSPFPWVVSGGFDEKERTKLHSCRGWGFNRG
eukprot:1382055-Amorphochlora_amoeboformis.AAC.1